MIVDLNKVLISPRIKEAWIGFVEQLVKELTQKYPDLKSNEIPIEQFRILSNGYGEIFIQVRNTTISMKVPPNEYQYQP